MCRIAAAQRVVVRDLSILGLNRSGGELPSYARDRVVVDIVDDVDDVIAADTV